MKQLEETILGIPRYAQLIVTIVSSAEIERKWLNSFSTKLLQEQGYEIKEQIFNQYVNNIIESWQLSLILTVVIHQSYLKGFEEEDFCDKLLLSFAFKNVRKQHDYQPQFMVPFSRHYIVTKYYPLLEKYCLTHFTNDVFSLYGLEYVAEEIVDYLHGKTDITAVKLIRDAIRIADYSLLATLSYLFGDSASTDQFLKLLPGLKAEEIKQSFGNLKIISGHIS